MRGRREKLRDVVRVPWIVGKYYWSRLLKNSAAKTDLSSTDLREALRLVPQWSTGHLLLAWRELKRLINAGMRNSDPRATATIEISVKAVEALEAKGAADEPSRRYLEAQLIAALLLHQQSSYAKALDQFRRVLMPANSVQLSRKHYYQALEYAAFAAFALELGEEAVRYLKLIPAAERSAESTALLGSNGGVNAGL